MPVKDRRMGVQAGFKLVQQQTIEVKVGVSFLDMDRAKENLGEIANGAILEFVMTDEPTSWRKENVPPSMSGPA